MLKGDPLGVAQYYSNSSEMFKLGVPPQIMSSVFLIFETRSQFVNQSINSGRVICEICFMTFHDHFSTRNRI